MTEYTIKDISIYGIYRLADGRIFRVTGHNMPEGGRTFKEKPGRYDYAAVGETWDENSGKWVELTRSVSYTEIGDKCPDPSALPD